jgi:competence protein ComEA
MKITQTLWELLDHRGQSSSLIDSAEPGTRDHFSSHTRPRRWKVGVKAGSVLVAVLVLVVVGSHFIGSLRTAPDLLPPVQQDTTVSPSEAPLVVHVVGAVVIPGVVTLDGASRVEDAIALAGGPTPDAELAGVNMARLVQDGEQIVVPRIGDDIAQPSAQDAGPISLSLADQATLETLPRIGPATAMRIIAWREVHGPFKSVEDLLSISGIGPATLEGLVDLVVP